jgi:phosphatidylglycerol:prolipoprotein diacylglycerol transferase
VRPVLFDIGSLSVHSYGVLVAVAFVCAWFVLRHELERRAGRGAAAYPLAVAAAAGGFVGARVYWFLEHLGDASATDSFSGAGFTWYGGLLGGAAAVLVVARRRQVSLTTLLGASAPALALGYGVGRIACQLAGDGTYGTPSDLPWAMSYPHGEVPTTVPVHPTPVYETLTSLVIFALLWHWRRRTSPVRLFAAYLALAGAERFLVEFVRRNAHVLLGLTQPQLFAAAMMLAGAVLLAAPDQAGRSRLRTSRASAG